MELLKNIKIYIFLQSLKYYDLPWGYVYKINLKSLIEKKNIIDFFLKYLIYSVKFFSKFYE